MSWKKSYLELKEEMETLQGQYYAILKEYLKLWKKQHKGKYNSHQGNKEEK